MIRILLSLLTFLSIQAHAQFIEDFNGTSVENFPPPGWLVTDNGIGNHLWQSSLAFVFEMNGTPFAFMNRQNILQGNTSKDYLITPLVSVPPGFNLFFTSKQTLAGNNDTTFEILVSTQSQSDLSTFQPLAFFTESEMNPVFNEMAYNSVSLASVQGQQVYLAFVRVTTQPTNAQTGDRWLLDDVIVSQFPVNPGFWVSGTLSYELGGNCSNTRAANKRILITTDLMSKTTFTDSDGKYRVFIMGNDLTVTPMPQNSNLVATPVSRMYDAENGYLIENSNFCLVPQQLAHDISVEIVPVAPARPGFNASYDIVYKNIGFQTVSGTIALEFDDDVIDLVSFDPIPQTQAVNHLQWSFANLEPFETRHLYGTFNLNSPMETPALNGGDNINFAVTAEPTVGDPNVSNNTFTIKQLVFNSYDPNDKQVFEGAQITPAQTGDYLHYLVRFQNTGSFYAERVSVRDEMDPKLDMATFEVLDASHSMRTTVQANQVEFNFENIMLPAEQDDEPNSHGYVLYKIKPLPNFMLGESISNTANIYFDFNYPIVTNTVVTEVTELGLHDETKMSVTLSPNPAHDSIDLIGNSAITQIRIYSLTGQLLREENYYGQNVISVAVADLKTGTYFLKINSENGQSTKKLIVR